MLNDEIEKLKSTISSNADCIDVLYEKKTSIAEKSYEDSTVCELCDYQASFSTVLKAHKTRKHIYEQKVLEQLRDAPLDISLKFASAPCTLNEYSSQNPEYSVYDYVKESESVLKCNYCGNIFCEGNIL